MPLNPLSIQFSAITGEQMVKIHRLLPHMKVSNPDHLIKLVSDSDYPTDKAKPTLFHQSEYVALRGYSKIRFKTDQNERLCIDELVTKEPCGYPLEESTVMSHFSLANPTDLETLATRLNVRI